MWWWLHVYCSVSDAIRTYRHPMARTARPGDPARPSYPPASRSHPSATPRYPSHPPARLSHAQAPPRQASLAATCILRGSYRGGYPGQAWLPPPLALAGPAPPATLAGRQPPGRYHSSHPAAQPPWPHTWQLGGVSGRDIMFCGAPSFESELDERIAARASLFHQAGGHDLAVPSNLISHGGGRPLCHRSRPCVHRRR